MRIFIAWHLSFCGPPHPAPLSVCRPIIFFFLFLPKSEITSCVSSVNMPRPNAENREGSPCVTKKRTKCRALWVCTTTYTDTLCPDRRRVYACLDFYQIASQRVCVFAVNTKPDQSSEFKFHMGSTQYQVLYLTNYTIMYVPCYNSKSKTGKGIGNQSMIILIFIITIILRSPNHTTPSPLCLHRQSSPQLYPPPQPPSHIG